MAYKLVYSIQDIAHSGSHIGRELEVDIKTSENISLNFRKRVLPDRTTKLDKELGSVVTEEEVFSLLLDVTLTEHDVLFNDVGNIKQNTTFNINQWCQPLLFKPHSQALLIMRGKLPPLR